MTMSGLLGEAVNVSGNELEANVEIALFQLQALRLRFRKMAHEHALHLRLAAPVAVKPVEHDNVVGIPAVECERARAGGIRGKPAAAHIAILFVLGDDFLVENGAIGARECAEFQRWRNRHCYLHDEGLVVLGAEFLVDIVRSITPVGVIGFGEQAKLDGTLQGIGNVTCCDLAPALERRLVVKGEFDRAVRQDVPGFCQHGQDFARRLRIVANQRVVEIGDDMVGFIGIDIVRIEAGQIDHIHADDQLILRRFCLGNIHCHGSDDGRRPRQ